MSGTAIRVRELRKSYGTHEAVRGISFEVGRGEVFGFLGPNEGVDGRLDRRDRQRAAPGHGHAPRRLGGKAVRRHVGGELGVVGEPTRAPLGRSSSRSELPSASTAAFEAQ